MNHQSTAALSLLCLPCHAGLPPSVHAPLLYHPASPSIESPPQPSSSCTSPLPPQYQPASQQLLVVARCCHEGLCGLLQHPPPLLSPRASEAVPPPMARQQPLERHVSQTHDAPRLHVLTVPAQTTYTHSSSKAARGPPRASPIVSHTPTYPPINLPRTLLKPGRHGRVVRTHQL